MVGPTRGTHLCAKPTSYHKIPPLGLRDFIIALKAMYAPSNTDLKERIREEYRDLLTTIRRGNVSIETWLISFEAAYYKALGLGITKVSGDLVIKDFLLIVRARLIPM